MPSFARPAVWTIHLKNRTWDFGKYWPIY